MDVPSIYDLEAKWIYSQSISPDSPDYEQDGINDFIKISMRNHSSDTIALFFQTPTKGNFLASFEGDTLVLAVSKRHEHFQLLPNDTSVILARTIQVISTQGKVSNHAIRNVFGEGGELMMKKVKMEYAKTFSILWDTFEISKASSYSAKIE